MNSDALLALADRCEKESGVDRELDCTIGKAVGFRPDVPESRQTSSPWAFSPPYTRSLDAAMTLVPDGVRWNVSMTPDSLKRWPSGLCASAAIGCPKTGRSIGPYQVIAATPALALTAAALRALAQMEDAKS